MAKLNNYNGHYCESDYEYAFISFLEQEGWIYLSGDKMPRVYGRDVLNTDDLEAFISIGKFFADLLCIIRRAVIDDQHLKISKALFF